MLKLLSTSLFALSLLALSGCAKGIGSFDARVEDLALLESGSGSQGTPLVPPPFTPDPVTPPPASTPGTSPGICGPLDFKGITWSSALNTSQQKGLSLSLSVSGSFEGRSSWANITNNFDGMGLSLGLLQQNLGSGSLQPMLLKFRSRNPAALKSFFTASDYSSLEAMLLDWSSFNPKLASQKIEAPEELFPEQEVLSDLDIGASGGFQQKTISTLGSAESESVTWARTTLYTDGGKTFITRWKNSLSQMAASANYRSIQAESAMTLFAKAESYFMYFGFTEMRSLLLMYDFVVQNGGFNSKHQAEFEAYLKSHPRPTETERAMNLLEIRLKSTVPEWTEDVRLRKTAIINAKGTVHGTKRDLAKEYCFDPYEKVHSSTLP